MPEAPMVDMLLCRIILRDGALQQYIHLKERGGERTFAIVIGSAEASEIQRVVCNQEMARPLTHQLAFNLVAELGWKIVGVDIVGLHKNTFYAEISLSSADDTQHRRVDARPSDAIALALRASCPIRVAEPVLEQVRIDRAPDQLEEPEEPPT
jgi:bifunctional DNase/RNase